MDRSKLLKHIKTIELKMRGKVQQIFTGNYQSAFKGRGMSFSEVRAYHYGDEVRSIDWNVTARLREPYIKVFEEERDLVVMALVDVSGSMYFGTGDTSKIERAIETAAILGFSAVMKGDKFGMLLISDEVEQYFPAKKGIDHVYYLLVKLIDCLPKSKKTNLSVGLDRLLSVQKQRSICFLISDFGSIQSIDKKLEQVVRRHDFIPVHITDPGEKSLPNVGFVRWWNAETGSTNWVDTSSAKVREQYAANYQMQLNDCKRIFERLRLSYVDIDTTHDPFPVLLQLFKNRK